MATLSQITMPNNTTHDILRNAFFGTCSTAAATADKVVTLSDVAGWSLKTGTIIGVKFTNSNSASSCTLNVNDSGAKSVWYDNAVYTGNDINICGSAGRTNYYMYDGTYWVWMNCGTIENAELKTATDQFITVNGGLLSKCMIDLEPVQDLHGYDSPWVGGAGKNKLADNLYSDGSSGSLNWNRNDDGRITIEATTPTANATRIDIGSVTLPSGSYILSGIDSTSNRVELRLRTGSVAGTDYVTCNSNNQSVAFTLNDATTLYGVFIVYNNYQTTVNASPMIRLATETDPTFAPYSNICPISGHTEVDLKVDGANLLDTSTVTIGGITFTESDNGYVTASPNDSDSRAWSYSNSQYKLTLSSGTYNLIVDVKTASASPYQAIDLRDENTSIATLYNALDHVGVTIQPFTINAKTNIGLMIKQFDAAARFAIVKDGSSAWTPYLGHLYQVQIGSTVYGGYVDLVSGVMNVDRACETITSMEYYGTYGFDNAPLFYKELSNIYRMYVSSDSDIYKPISNAYKAWGADVGTSMPNNFFRTQAMESTHRFYFRDDRFSSKAQIDTWLANNPVQVCGFLATPQTIQLTPQQIETLAGQNNLSTPLDGQSIETNGVEYKELFTFADVKEYVKTLIPYSNAGSHNAIYRGKYLGSSVTAGQWSAIQNGTFDDLFIGDYWTINSVNWRIAHFDYWLGIGDTECTDHHVVIVPDTNLYMAKMNSTDITTGGYYNSEMRGGANYLVNGSSNLYSASETIKSAFGSSHILTHRMQLTNNVSSGNASGWAWYDSSVDLMNEIMVYGASVWSIGGKGYEVGSNKGQLALFRHDITKTTNRYDWWLRGIVNSNEFAVVDGSGSANGYGASRNYGVRPAFAIK